MATSMTLDYDKDDKRAVTMINLLLASGLFTQRPSIDAALDDVAAGRINHYSSLDELKVRLDKARQEIASGNCVTCKTQDELDNFLAFPSHHSS